MANRKAAFIIIIVLLVISIPCSIIGIAYKFISSNKEITPPTIRPNQEFYQDGILNFYDYGELLGQYSCKNVNGYCGWAFETIDDDHYNLKYYNDDSIDNIYLVSNRYAFLIDIPEVLESYENREIILYDVIDAKEISTYKGVKDYSVGINNDYYIVKNEEDKWGVIQLTGNGLTEVIPFEYDYIGLKEDLNSSTLKIISNIFAVLKNDEWFLIDLNNSQLSRPVATPIINYNKDSMIVNYYSKESLFNYQGIVQLGGQAYNYIEYVKDYVGYIDNNNNFSVIDYNTDAMITQDSYHVNNYKDIELVKKEDGSVDIYIFGEFKETIS